MNLERDPMDLRPLLNPRSIVVIGASPDPTRIGGRPLAQTREHGFEGQIYCTNPRYQEVQGYSCFPDIDCLPAAPDCALLAVNAEAALGELRRCAARGSRQGSLNSEPRKG